MEICLTAMSSLKYLQHEVNFLKQDKLNEKKLKHHKKTGKVINECVHLVDVYPPKTTVELKAIYFNYSLSETIIRIVRKVWCALIIIC